MSDSGVRHSSVVAHVPGANMAAARHSLSANRQPPGTVLSTDGGWDAGHRGEVYEPATVGVVRRSRRSAGTVHGGERHSSGDVVRAKPGVT